MGKEPSGAKKFKNVRIYHASWEKVIGRGKMYETFADVLDRILDQFSEISQANDEKPELLDAADEDL